MDADSDEDFGHHYGRDDGHGEEEPDAWKDAGRGVRRRRRIDDSEEEEEEEEEDEEEEHDILAEEDDRSMQQQPPPGQQRHGRQPGDDGHGEEEPDAWRDAGGGVRRRRRIDGSEEEEEEEEEEDEEEEHDILAEEDDRSMQQQPPPGQQRHGRQPGVQRQRGRGGQPSAQDQGIGSDDSEGGEGAEEIYDDVQERYDATHTFKGFDLFKDKLYNRNVRHAELYGLQSNDETESSMWRNVLFTPICGAGTEDQLYAGEGHWTAFAPNQQQAESPSSSYRREHMPDSVQSARSAWFDKRPRNSDGTLEDPSQQLGRGCIRNVKAAIPCRSYCINISQALRAQNASRILDCNYAYSKSGSDNKQARRAIATAEITSAIFQCIENGFKSGQHVEYQATLQRRDEANDVEQDGAADVKGDKDVELRSYEFFYENQRTRMMLVECERLVDAQSSHITHGVRVWIHVFHPYFSHTQILAKLFELNRTITNCDEVSCYTPRKDKKDKYDRTRNAAPNPAHQDRKPDETYDGKESWWHLKDAEEFVRAIRVAAGRPWDLDEQLSCGTLHSSVDAEVSSCVSSTGGALPFDRAYPQASQNQEEHFGGTSSASPEIVLNAKRKECLAQFLFGDDMKPSNVHPDQLNPSLYFGSNGELRLPPIVRDEGLMYVYTPVARECNPLNAQLPASFRFRLEPGPTLLKMTELHWRDNRPKADRRTRLRPIEVTSHLQQLMQASHGATNGATQRVGSLSGHVTGLGEQSHEANSLKPSARNGLDDNLLTDAQDQSKELHKHLVLSAAAQVERFRASVNADGETAEVKKLRVQRLQTLEMITGLCNRRGLNEDSPGMKIYFNKLEQIDKQLNNSRARAVPHMVRFVLGMEYVPGAEKLKRTAAEHADATARQNGQLPVAVLQYEKERVQNVMCALMDELIEMMLTYQEQLFQHDMRHLRIPAGWLRMYEGLPQLMRKHGVSTEEMQSATNAFKNDAGGWRMAARDRTMLGLSQNRREGYLHQVLAISGAERPMLWEMDTQSMGSAWRTTQTVVVNGEASSGKSSIAERYTKTLYPDQGMGGATTESAKAGSHGADGVSNASLIIHDEMPAKLTFHLKKGKLETPREEDISNLKSEHTERIRRSAKSAAKSEEQLKRMGGTSHYTTHISDSALWCRVVCSNMGPLLLKYHDGRFNERVNESSFTAVLSRTVGVTKFKSGEQGSEAVIHRRSDNSGSAFDRNMSAATNAHEGKMLAAEILTLRLMTLAKVMACRIEFLQPNPRVPKDLWEIMDKKYLAPLACFSPQSMSTNSQRFQDRRLDILWNCTLREAVTAQFMIGETALEFPDSRPVIKGAHLHLPKFELRQLRATLKMASEASTGAIIWAWVQSLEYVVGISGGCESTIRQILCAFEADPHVNGVGDVVGKETGKRQRDTAVNGGDGMNDLGVDGFANPQYEESNIPVARRTLPIRRLPNVVSPEKLTGCASGRKVTSLQMRLQLMTKKSFLRHEMRMQGVASGCTQMRSLKMEIEEHLSSRIDSMVDPSKDIGKDEAVAQIMFEMQPDPQELATVAKLETFYDYVRHAEFSRSVPINASGQADHMAATRLYLGGFKPHLMPMPEVVNSSMRDHHSAFQIQNTRLQNDSGNSDHGNHCYHDLATQLSTANDMRAIERCPIEVSRDTMWMMVSEHDRRPYWLLPRCLPKQHGALPVASCCTKDIFDTTSGPDGLKAFLKFPPLLDSDIDELDVGPRDKERLRYARCLRSQQGLNAAKRELLTGAQAQKVANLMFQNGQVQRPEDGAEWARLCNLRRVPEVTCLSVAAAQETTPFSFENGVFTVNQTWLLEMSRLAHAAALQQSLIPGQADYDLTSHRPATNEKLGGAGSQKAEIVSSRLPRAHRSFQMYIAAQVCGDFTNDTMLCLQDELVHKRRELNRYDVMRQAPNHAELGLDVEDDDGLRDIVSSSSSTLQDPTLTKDDVPEFTIPFAAYSTEHDPLKPQQSTTRLISIKPRVAESYNKELQSPTPNVSTDSDAFVQANVLRDGSVSNKMTTSWVREHACASMKARFLRPSADGADPCWRVWEDFDNNVRSHHMKAVSDMYQQVNFAYLPTNNGQPVPLKPTHLLARGDDAKPLDTASNPKVHMPVQMLFPDVASDINGICYDYCTHESSLADTLLRHPDGTVLSFRQQMHALNNPDLSDRREGSGAAIGEAEGSGAAMSD